MNTIEPVIDAYTALVPFFNDGEEGVNDVIFADFVLNYTESWMHDALEVGCGVGKLARRVAQRIPYVIAIDATPAMIECARSAPTANVEFVIRKIEEYPPNHKFDFIYSLMVFDHLDRQCILPKLREMLNPNGVLVYVDRFAFMKLDMQANLSGAVAYYKTRWRLGLSFNLVKLMSNMGRISKLAEHPAFVALDKISEPYHITSERYVGLLREELPSATFDIIGPSTALVVYRKPNG